MDHLKLFPFSLCRVPAFPAAMELKNAWEELKAMIAEASPAFYELIRELEAEELHLLGPKARLTIYKYFNRARHRATPFGRFASVTLLPPGDAKQAAGRIILGPHRYHTFTDWSAKQALEDALRSANQYADYYQTNGTVYVSSKQIKYLFFNGSTFELSSVAYDPFIYDLLLFARVTRRKNELLNFIRKEKAIEKKAADQLLPELIRLQLLLDDHSPNITGPDYFERNGLPLLETAPTYTITEREPVSGRLAASFSVEVAEAIHFLNAVLPLPINNDLENFKSALLERFGESEIALSVALDPETGPGYGGLESGFLTHDAIVNDIQAILAPETGIAKIPYGEFQQFLLSSWQESPCIQLDLYPTIPSPGGGPRLPNTFSAVVGIAEGLLLCERIGGSTANALLGRFSLAGHQFEEMGKAIAETEIRANPGVVFFDIAYMAEDKVDNVNRRRLLYPLEFPILSYATGADRIELDDLLVAVRHGEIVLRSKKLKKRVIPKIASAYNYVRSDLSLFRFMADLQHQHIRSTLSFDLPSFFPGLSRYPRVQFKNVVLSPARWLIPEIFTSAGDTADTGRTTEFRRWLGDNNIHLFSYGPGDQKLIFDADNNGDLDAFLAIVKGKARSYIAESIPLLKGLVGDSENRSYNAEFIWIFYHENQLYRSLPETSSPDGHFPKTRYLPGQEWLYFEIYCHYATSNRILTSYLAKFITAHRRMITQWFFIRYNSPSYHIRLRVKLRDLRDGYPMMSALSSILEEAMLSGIIPDIQLKPYVREVERYGASQIAKAENFFFRNSSLILKVISMDFSAGERYGLSICLMESILEESDYGYPERLAFYTRMEQGFATEFSMTTQAFKKLNEGFASFSKQSKDFAVEKRIGSNQWRTMKKAFQNCVNSSSPLLKEKMIADLFHMHVNRLFENQQRMHEMIIYSYLKTRLKRKYYAKPGKPR